jgi:hypothetical protein
MDLLALLFATQAFGATGPAATQAFGAINPAPAVCGQAHVLEAVQARLSRAGQPVEVEAGSAGQVPGARGDVVYCAVRVRTAVYDTPRLGVAPAVVVQDYRYALELRRNGVFLLP